MTRCRVPRSEEIIKGAVVTFEIGVDPKSGKSKAVSVDLV
jgi:hypothetical protein